MEFLIFLALISIVVLLIVIYVELEKVLDNTFELGDFIQSANSTQHKLIKKIMKGKK